MMLNSNIRPDTENIQEIVCQTCHGEGSKVEITQKVEPCISCRGTGQVKQSRCFVCLGEGVQQITKTEIHDCDPCQGAGWIVAEPVYASVG